MDLQAAGIASGRGKCICDNKTIEVSGIAIKFNS
jgi:hypothetical protein